MPLHTHTVPPTLLPIFHLRALHLLQSINLHIIYHPKFIFHIVKAINILKINFYKADSKTGSIKQAFILYIIKKMLETNMITVRDWSFQYWYFIPPFTIYLQATSMCQALATWIQTLTSHLSLCSTLNLSTTSYLVVLSFTPARFYEGFHIK